MLFSQLDNMAAGTPTSMDEFDFTEEEIEEQLHKLGYYNVPAERLREFKRDLEKLVKQERSGNSSWSTLVDGSSTDSEMGRDPMRARVPLDEAGNRQHGMQINNNGAVDHLRYGKENQSSNHIRSNGGVSNMPSSSSACHVANGGLSQPAQSFPRPIIMPSVGNEYSLHSDQTKPQHGLMDDSQPSAADESIQVENTTLDTTAMSDRKLIKRRVLRKKDGKAEVTDELTESEMGDISSIEDRLQQLDVEDGRRPYTAPSQRSVSAVHARPHTAQTAEDAYREYMQHYKRPHSAASSVSSYRLPEDYEGPKALIRPMKCDPHTRNIKRSDPVASYQKYKSSWTQQKAPGEKQHKNLRWNVREQMLYHDEVVDKKQQKVYKPNAYVIPSDKKRKNIRWQIRHELAQGMVPPSAFDNY